MTSTTSFATWTDAVLIPLTLLVPTDWNVNEMGEAQFAELLISMRRERVDEPLDVLLLSSECTWCKPEHRGRYLILSGEHRYKGALALGYETIPCVIKHELAKLSKEELIEWSITRNGIKGKINAQKYAQIEHSLMRRKAETAEAVRSRLLIRGEALKSLRKTEVIRDAEDPTTSKGGRDKTRATSTAPAKSAGKADADDDDGDEDAPSASRDRTAGIAATARALAAQILSDDGASVEHGYVYFGHNGKQHLMIEQDGKLAALVRDMMGACDGRLDSVQEFLRSAISKELKLWS